jgi:hypothetical protein
MAAEFRSLFKTPKKDGTHRHRGQGDGLFLRFNDDVSEAAFFAARSFEKSPQDKIS